MLPSREYVFLLSLMYHGFRLTYRRKGLKWKKGYVIPSSCWEDGSGTDFWVKMPRSDVLHEVQVTQRGIEMFKDRYKNHSKYAFAEFVERSKRRVALKKATCEHSGTVFVLVRDFAGSMTNEAIAWSDIKALRRSIASFATRHKIH